MSRPTPAALAAVALAAVLALTACTPPRGEGSGGLGESPSATPTEESSATSSPRPSDDETGDDADSTPSATPSSSPSATGGSASTGEYESVRGLPSGVEAPVDATGGVGWNEAGDALLVVTLGSSSCPLLPQEVTVADDAVEITLTDTGGAVCTTDWVPTVTTVPAPSGLASDAAVTAVLGDLGQVTVPAAATPPAIGWIAAEAG